MSNFFDNIGNKFEAMGNVFKQQASGSGARSSASSSSSSSSSNVNSYCNDCRTQFPSLFPKKLRCAVCRYYFCRTCIASIPVNGRVQLGSHLPLRDAISSSVAPACSRCQILSNPNFTYDQLMSLRVRDLFWYLQRTGTPNEELRGLKEKSQLADLVMERFGSEDYRRQRASSRLQTHERVAQMATNLEQLVGGSSGGQQQQQQQQPDHDSQEQQQEGRQPSEADAVSTETETDQIGAIPNVPPPPYPGAPEPEEPNSAAAAAAAAATTATIDTESGGQAVEDDEDEIVEGIDIEVAQDAALAETLAGLEAAEAQEAAAAAAAASSTPPSHPPVTSIDQIITEADLDQLSVREMKQLLSRNFVDYKGCLERAELLDRLRRLYRERAESREAVLTDRLADSDLCKICMDAAIDCVLLECGHMVTCVTCGKQCSDCPVCRQYVVRVVRTFKS